jgi:hypothetical protein
MVAPRKFSSLVVACHATRGEDWMVAAADHQSGVPVADSQAQTVLGLTAKATTESPRNTLNEEAFMAVSLFVRSDLKPPLDFYWRRNKHLSSNQLIAP